MWKCPKCGRMFKKVNQVHSCKKIPLDGHFKSQEDIKYLYDFLLSEIKNNVGDVQEISLPCCIHLFGNYDFIAILPKKDRLEIRIALEREIKDSRIFTTVPLSSKYFKNCFNIYSKEDIDTDVISWIKESYWLKE